MLPLAATTLGGTQPETGQHSHNGRGMPTVAGEVSCLRKHRRRSPTIDAEEIYLQAVIGRIAPFPCTTPRKTWRERSRTPIGYFLKSLAVIVAQTLLGAIFVFESVGEPPAKSDLPTHKQS